MTDEERVRDLLGQTFDVDPPRSVGVLADQVRTDHRRRRTLRTGAAGGGVVVVAVAALVLPAALRSSSSPSGPAAAGPSVPTPTTTAPAAPATGHAVDPNKVLADGDLVQASGRVVKVPGKPLRFCGPEMSDAVAWAPGHEPAPKWCPLGVAVDGVDLAALSRPRTKDGATEGDAYLRGTWSGGVLHVSRQTAPRYDQALTPGVTSPPCPEPAGGWPKVAAGSNPYDEQSVLDAYRKTHPDAIVSEAVARPNAHAAFMVVAVEDLAATRAVLKAVPGKLCLLQSRYTRAQIDAVRTPWEQDMRSHLKDGQGLVTGIGEGVGPAGQATVELDVLMTTALVAQRVAAAPAGLVTVKPWLQPISTDAPLPPLPVTPTATGTFTTATASGAAG